MQAYVDHIIYHVILQQIMQSKILDLLRVFWQRIIKEFGKFKAKTSLLMNILLFVTPYMIYN